MELKTIELELPWPQNSSLLPYNVHHNIFTR